jgi:Ras family protein A
MEEPPPVTILLLGDAECGKTSFISYAPFCIPRYPLHRSLPIPSIELMCSSFRRISKGTTGHSTQEPLTLLKDSDQPFCFDIRFYNRPYRFEFYDTGSPDHWALLKPHVIVLCYDVSSRLSLINVQRVVCLSLIYEDIYMN